MSINRQATLDALNRLPQNAWIAYLTSLRDVNLMIGKMSVDSTPYDALEAAIQETVHGRLQTRP